MLNKVDQVKPKSALLGAIAEMNDRMSFAEIIPLSAWRKENLDSLLDVLPTYLPKSPPLFPVEMITDRSDIFRIGELIREKLTLMLRDELPYGLAVVHAIIWVERDSQKGIVIGKGGAMLKDIGRSARLAISRQLDRPVHLELWVKVKSNWANNEKDLQSLGYEAP